MNTILKRRFLLVATLILLGGQYGFSQGWQWLNPSPNSNNIASIAWRTSTSLWAVGSWGGAVISEDGGVTWKERLIAPGYTMTYLKFIDPRVGWLLGAGVVFRTVDSGKTWSLVSTGAPGGTVFYRIAFGASTQNAWISGSGGVVMRTTNGGTSWTRLTIGTTQSLSGTTFADDKNGWVCGSGGTVYRTTNAGLNWSKLTISTTAWLRDMVATSLVNVKLVADGGRIYTSTNSGTTWAASNTNSTRNFVAVAFSDYSRGVTVADGGTIKLTEDGGTSWSNPVCPYFDNLTAAAFATGQRWAVAGNGGRVLTSEDGGRTWTTRSSGPTTDFYGASFVDSAYGWVSGRNGEIWKTTNGGKLWSQQTTGTIKSINAIFFLNRTTGWAVGDTLTILKTTNGGTNWIPQTAPVTARVSLYDVRFLDANQGWACGSTGAYLFHTSNGGTTWTAVYTSLSQNVQLRRMAIKLPSVWAVGNNGTIYQTFDAGDTWAKLTTGTTAALYGVAFSTPLKGLACGAGGTMILTRDGGSTWTADTTNTSQTLLDVRANGDTVRACGTGGALLRSTNFGSTWLFAQPLVTANQINVLSAIGGRQAFAAGLGGTILKSYTPQSALASSRRIFKFDSLQVDSCKSLSLTLYNAGDDSLRIDSVFMQGTDSAFTMTVGATLPLTLLSGDSIVITSTFCGKDSGSHQRDLIVHSTSNSSPDKFHMEGYAGRYAFGFPDTLLFTVPVGSDADSVVTLSNQGTLTLHVNGVLITGADGSGDWTISGVATPMDVLPGDSLPIRVFYTSRTSGVHENFLTITTPDTNITMVLWANGVNDVTEFVPSMHALALFPHPATGVSSVRFGGGSITDLRVVDMLGRTVWSAPRASSGATIALPQLRAGTYTIVARASGGVITKPFIVR
jgi:photosystem II stability/assembly factor-like uncharacterized protein